MTVKKIVALFLCLLFCSGAFALAEETWSCRECGMENYGNYCEYCGAEKATEDWTCPACGSRNAKLFCPVCGAKRPVPVFWADLTIRDYGTVTIRLETEAAPITAANFIELAGSGFYNGLTFHRIIEGFMMQGGDPMGNGMGGSSKTIKGEFAANGVDTGLSHTRGAVSMARSQSYNSASSQFFIVHQDSTYLDGQYAVFGYVTEGMDVVDKVCTEAKPVDGNGTIPASAQPVIDSVRIIYE